MKVTFVGDASSLKRATDTADASLSKVDKKAQSAAASVGGVGSAFSKFGSASGFGRLEALSSAFSKLDAASDKSGDKLDKFASKLQVGGAAAVAFAGLAAPALFKLGDAAGDLQETLSKSSVIFGSASSQVEKFGSSAATSIGLSKRAAIDAAATFGTLFTNIGKSEREAAEMSITMTRLAGDLASFSNASPEEAVQALGAALRGESEPIRRFGVLLDDATLKQRALTLGIFNGTGSLTTATRAQAAYAEILAQTTKQQGDFARTSDSLANQQRILAANFENLKTQIGAGVAPAIGSIVGGANTLLTKFNELDPAVLKTTGSLAVFGTGAIGAVGGLSVLAGSLTKMRHNLTDAEGGLNAFGKVGIAVGGVLAVGGIIKALEQIGQAFDADRNFADAAAKGFIDYGKAVERVDDIIREQASHEAALGNVLNVQGKGRNLQARQLHDNLEQLDEILRTGNIPAAHEYARAMGAAGLSTEAADGKIKKATDAYVAYKTQTKDTARALDDAAFLAERMGDAFGEAKIPVLSLRDAEAALLKITKETVKAQADLNRELADYDSFLKRTTESTYGLRDADIEWNKSLLEFKDTVAENGKVFNTFTKEGIANNEALSKVRDTVADMIGRLSENAVSVKDLNDKTRPYVTTLLESARAAGLNNKELATLSKFLSDLIQQQEINIRINLIPNMDRAKLNAIGAVNPEDVAAILGYDTGGVVDGAKGSPKLALVHAGETILPTHKMGLDAALEQVTRRPNNLDMTALRVPAFGDGGVVGTYPVLAATAAGSMGMSRTVVVNINAPVYGVNDLKRTIKEAVQQGSKADGGWAITLRNAS